MTALELLHALKQLGATAQPNGERLRIEAPKGAVTPELREALLENKAEVLQLLRLEEGRQESKASASAAPIERRRCPQCGGPLEFEADEKYIYEDCPCGHYAAIEPKAFRGWHWLDATGQETVSGDHLCELLTKANQSGACVMRFRERSIIGEREDAPIRRDQLNNLLTYGEAIGRFLEGAGLKNSFCIECGQYLIFELSQGYGYKRAICNYCGWMRIW